MRILDVTFMNDLVNGRLIELLNYIKYDHTLDFQIRNNEVHVYYRGGKVLGVTIQNGLYKFSFDFNYFNHGCPRTVLKEVLEDCLSKMNWISYFPLSKQVMDFYFSKSAKEEREFQQLIVRENNYSSVANSSDYFVVDIEYDNKDGARFDIIAVEWPSVSSNRKLQKNFKPKLVVIEMKYGDRAISGSSGMKKHCNDFNNFFSNPNVKANFKLEMTELFKQKRKLGLIPCLSNTVNNNEVDRFDDEIELIFLISNHDPASSKLNTELTSLANENAKFVTSNFMGYHLYNQNIYNLSEFLSQFNNQIYEL